MGKNLIHRLHKPRKYQDVRDGLVLDLSLGENVTGDIIDHSGHGNDGVKTGTNIVKDSETLKNVLNFDGVDDNVVIKIDESLNFGTGSFTILFFGHLNELVANNRDIIAKKKNAGEAVLLIRSRNDGNDCLFQLYSGADDKIEVTNVDLFDDLDSLNLYTFVIDREANKGLIYLNEDFRHSKNATGNPNENATKAFNISKGVFSGGYSKVTLSFVRIYNKALSADEVKQLSQFLRHKMGLLPL